MMCHRRHDMKQDHVTIVTTSGSYTGPDKCDLLHLPMRCIFLQTVMNCGPNFGANPWNGAAVTFVADSKIGLRCHNPSSPTFGAGLRRVTILAYSGWVFARGL